MSTVGIVLISHSRALAEGAAELAVQMGVGKVAVRPAGGAADGGLGTSLDLVAQAVREADGGAGVVLIADLGSSVLTARSYLEDLEEDGAASGPAQVVLADAPFVEGAVAAASAAAAGLDLAAVVQAAREAYDFHKT